LSLSDRIAVMCAGQAIEIGTPTSLYLRPRRLFTARFIGQTELLAATVVAHSNEVVTVETDIGSIKVSHDVAALSAESTLMIRPEHMELVDPESTQDNVVFGSIEKVDFTGRVVEYTVCVAARQLRVQSLSAVIRRCGENVGVYLPPERCVLIDESE
jgi:ABC-type Fe3+/spermidine/putrescine transport system ATPase subunit